MAGLVLLTLFCVAGWFAVAVIDGRHRRHEREQRRQKHEIQLRASIAGLEDASRVIQTKVYVGDAGKLPDPIEAINKEIAKQEANLEKFLRSGDV